MNNKAFFKYIFALLMFGSNGIVASFIDLSSQNIVLLRTLIGSILLIVLLFISGGKLTFYKHKGQFLFLAVSGIAMGTSWMFLYEAYARIGVSVSSLLYYCGPVIVMALSPLLFKEKLTANKVLGFLTVVIGVVLINGNAFDGKGDLFGITCGLLSENSTLQLTIAFLTVAIFVGLKQGYTMQIAPTSIVPILILGLLNTGVGCYFYFSSIGKLRVQTVAICGYLEPLSAVIFSVIFLKETMLPLQIIGAVLIIGGAMCGELVKQKVPEV